MQLEDFQTPQLNLEDFSRAEKREGPLLSSRGTAQIAGSISLTYPEEADPNRFRTLRDSLTEPLGRSSFVTQDLLRNNISNYFQNNIDVVMQDESLTDDQKSLVIDMIQQQENTPRSTVVSLAESALFDPMDTNEEEEEIRNSLAEIILPVLESRQRIQNLINGYKENNPVSDLQTLGDFAEIVVPFAEYVQINQLASEFDIDLDIENPDRIFLGELKKELFDQVKSLPVHQRAEFTEKVIELLEDNDTVIFGDGNQIHALHTLEVMSGSQDYSNFERWFDNIITVLDVVGVGALVKFGVKGVKAGKATEEVLLLPKAESVVNETSKTSPSQVVKETSPDRARVIHDDMLADETGEVAEAMYGTNRAEAAVEDTLPKPELLEDIIPNKVKMDEEAFGKTPQDRVQMIKDGRAYVPEDMIKAQERKTVQSFMKVEGFNPHLPSMTIKSLDDGSTVFNLLFRPINTGWKTAEAALDNSLFALRDYGATADDLTLYRRVDGDRWQKTTQKELAALKEAREVFTKKKKRIPDELKEIDYAVALSYKHDLNISELGGFEPWTVKRNWFDNLGDGGLGQGTLTSNFLDPLSFLPPDLVKNAGALVDKGFAFRKKMVDDLREGFIEPRKSLPKDRRNQIDEYIRDANLNEIKLTTADLTARGFTPDEIKILKRWRKSNDALWHFSNLDLVKTLRARGYQVFQDSNQSRFIVQPTTRNQVNSNTYFYNSATNDIEKLNTKDLDDLYNKGGQLSKLSEPTLINGQYVDYVKTLNTPQGGYLRPLKTDEVVLHYRDGYYPVMYDANFFVDKKIMVKGGREETKTIATSRTSKEAAKVADMLQASAKAGERYLARQDRLLDRGDFTGMSQSSWNVAVSSGLSNQRVRGKRLLDVESNMHKAGHSNLIDPLEAVSQQISKLSERVYIRDYMETAKKRWIDQYFDDLKLEKDSFGNKWFPTNIKAVKANPGVSMKVVRDARSIAEYLNRLEQGWVNGIDMGWKGMFNTFANISSEIPALERWFLDHSRSSGLTSSLKGAAFKAYLATNPIRQFIIQAHQSVQLSALFPRYMAGGLQRDYYKVSRASLGYTKDPEGLEMLTEMRNSGILEAVDANNLIRQDALRLRDEVGLERVKKLAHSPIELAQTVGFDVGERWVLISSWLAHRDAKLKAKGGKKLTTRDYDEIAGESRAFTYMMNRAGDMPHNQNTLAIITQFLQVPQKAILQPLFNRNLTRAQRARLFTWNTVMYGVPTFAVASTFLSDMEEGPIKRTLIHGFEDVLLNQIASWATGETQDVNWGDFAPTELHGVYITLKSLFTTDIGTLIAESPSGSLFFGQNPRLTDAFKTAMRWIIPGYNYEDPELAVKYTDVATSFLSISSGFSNAFKTSYALESGKFMSSLGNITDDDVTKFEAAMRLAGFRTHTEDAITEFYKMQEQQTYKKEDVRKWYEALKKTLARRGQNVQDDNLAQMIISEGYRVFGLDEYRFREQLNTLILEDVRQGNLSIFENLTNQIGIMSQGELRTIVSNLPESERKNQLIQILDKFEENQELLKQVEEGY